MAKQYLLTPGPTPVPEQIQKEMSAPIIHHRTTQYSEIFAAANKSIKKIFKTESDIITLCSSGTGAMEASVVNTLSIGDTAIVVLGGKFGERFAKICEAYGVNVIPVNIPWGSAPDPKEVAKLLEKHPNVKAVFANLCETSTATVFDIKALGEVVSKTNAILVVDVISGLGADEFKMDEWKVDVAVGGSQKGLMLPPGLAFIAFSKKAWAMAERSTLPKFYLDMKKYKKALDKSDVPFTPAITLEIGLKKAMDMIETEGVDNFIARHRQNCEFVKAETKKMGLGLYSSSPSYAVTAVNVPSGVDGSALIKACKAKGVTFAGGQDELKGKIVRIAHMGGITRDDLAYAMGVLADALKELKK